MSYPERPHLRFPFTRRSNAMPSIDAGEPADVQPDTVDGGSITTPPSDGIDGGSAWGFQGLSAGVDVVEQDTIEHVMSCELVIVNHPLGYRSDRPEFGWDWPELAGMPLDLGSLEQALRQFEPRGTANAAQYADAAVAALQHVSVDVAIASTQDE